MKIFSENLVGLISVVLYLSFSLGVTAHPVGSRVPVIIYQGEKMDYAVLEPVLILNRLSRHRYRIYKEWNRVRLAVYVCYPYLQTILKYMKEVEDSAAYFTTSKQKRQFIRAREKELHQRFGERLRNMTIFEGEILLKLLYRETHRTGYTLVKELLGGFRAAIYQGIAMVFGGSLKYTYDPSRNEEDRKIETVYQEVQKTYGR